MADAPARIYWDSCAWIGLVNEEADKIHALRLVWEAAKVGKCIIYTSAYTYFEFLNGHPPHEEAYSPEEDDRYVEDLLNQAYVRRMQVDIVVGRLGRKLKRNLHKDGLKKRPDALHLASALICEADEMHTYDGSHLLQFDRKLKCKSGRELPIIKASKSQFGQNLFSPADEDDKTNPPDGS